jgi:hypothetical protein
VHDDDASFTQVLEAVDDVSKRLVASVKTVDQHAVKRRATQQPALGPEEPITGAGEQELPRPQAETCAHGPEPCPPPQRGTTELGVDADAHPSANLLKRVTLLHADLEVRPAFDGTLQDGIDSVDTVHP